MEINPELMALKDKLEGAITNLDEFHGEYVFRASIAGDCPRLMDYCLQQPSGNDVPDSTQCLKMMMGQVLHDMWQGILKQVLGDDFGFIEGEIELVAEDGEVRVSIPGHPDGEIYSLDAIYELKNVSDNTFTKVVNDDSPLPSHYEQGNVYANARNRKWILFHYFNRNNGESFFILSPASASIVEDTKKKFLQRVKNLKSGVIEDRPYNDPTDSPCFFCSRKDQCYDGWIGEVKKFSDINVAPDSVEGKAVLDLDSSNKMRLEMEKVEKRCKKIVTDIMVKYKASKMIVDDKGLSANFKLGTKQNPLVSIKKEKL